MATIGQSGSVSPGRWWSVTITSTPSRRASSTSRDGGDAAVHREEKLHAFLGEPRDRRRGDAVAFLEPAREMPDDVGAELSQRQGRERRGADAVDVVVAVDADPLAPLDGRAQPLDSRRHVAEQQADRARCPRAEERASRRRDRRALAARARLRRSPRRRAPPSALRPRGTTRARPSSFRPCSHDRSRPGRSCGAVAVEQAGAPVPLSAASLWRASTRG